MPDQTRSQSHSESRPVRMLASRQPIPRDLGGRLGRVRAALRRVPFVPAGLIWVCFMGFGVTRYIQTSAYFQIDAIDVEGEKRLSEERLLSYIAEKSGITTGDSLLAFKAQDVEAMLALLPEVKNVRVEKVWPNQVRVELQERQVAGVFVSTTGSYVFDDTGYVFSHCAPDDFRAGELLTLTGFDEENLEPGHQIPPAPFALLREYENTFTLASPQTAESVSELHWDSTSGVTLVMEGGARFRCGMRNPGETGPVVEALLAKQEPMRRIASANLVASQHAAVRWETPGSDDLKRQLAQQK